MSKTNGPRNLELSCWENSLHLGRSEKDILSYM